MPNNINLNQRDLLSHLNQALLIEVIAHLKMKQFYKRN